jgi:hypothetical protein
MIFIKYCQLYLIFLSFELSAQTNSVAWMKHNGSYGTDMGASNFTDTRMNAYSCGIFSDTLNLDGENLFLKSNGRTDIYVMKRDSLGDLVWANSFGGIVNDGTFMDPMFGGVFPEGVDVTVDHTGNVYLIGSFSGIVDFDPSQEEYILNTGSLNSESSFVLKLDSDGNFIFAKAYKNIRFNSCMAVDSDSLLLAGSFFNKADFDAGIDSFILNSPGISHAFLLKLSPDGDFNKCKEIFSTGSAYINHLAINFSNNQLYISGVFYQEIDFNPLQPGTHNYTSDYYDCFLVCMTTTFGVIWSHAFSGTDNDAGIVAKGNDVFFSAVYRGTPIINTTQGDVTLINKGYADFFVIKLNELGLIKAVRSFGGSNDDFASDIELDNEGNLYLCGSFKDTMTLEHQNGSFQIINPAYRSALLIKLNNELEYKSHLIGSGSPIFNGIFDFNSISISRVNTVNVLGTCTNGAFFDCDQTNTLISTIGGYDIVDAQINLDDTSLTLNTTVANSGCLLLNDISSENSFIIKCPELIKSIEIMNLKGAQVNYKSTLINNRTTKLEIHSESGILIVRIATDLNSYTNKIIKR